MSAEICPACGQPRLNGPSAGPYPSCAASPAGGPAPDYFPELRAAVLDAAADYYAGKQADPWAALDAYRAAVAAHHRAEGERLRLKAEADELYAINAESALEVERARATRLEAALRQMRDYMEQRGYPTELMPEPDRYPDVQRYPDLNRG